jgi:hypothetical protein
LECSRAEELGAFGVTKAQAQQGYQTIAECTANMLQNFRRHLSQSKVWVHYTQATAEQEVFGIPGAAEAAAKASQISRT